MLQPANCRVDWCRSFKQPLGFDRHPGGLPLQRMLPSLKAIELSGHLCHREWQMLLKTRSVGVLEHLSLASCRGTLPLSSVLHHLPNLVTLDLSYTSIGDADLAVMVRSARSMALQKLCSCDCKQ